MRGDRVGNGFGGGSDTRFRPFHISPAEVAMLRMRPTALAVALPLLLAVPSPALAAGGGVPSPANCTLPTFVVGSPDGSFTAQVVVRDVAGFPVASSNVVLDFSGCPQYHACNTVCAGCTPNPTYRTVAMTADAAGTVRFGLHMGGGGCPNPPIVAIHADGILLGTSHYASVDMDGDLAVTTADLADAQALLGTNDPRADFDGDGAVTGADIAILQAHMGTSCTGPVPVRPSTWGSLKSV